MTVLPDKRSFTIWRGATFRHEFVLHQGDENSPVVNLTGCSAVVRAKNHPGGTVLEEYPLVVDGTAGKVTLTITDEDTAVLPWRNAFYTLFVTFPSGDTNAYLYGSLTVRET